MRIFLSLFLLLSVCGFSQSKTSELVFNTKYYNAVDQWIAFPKKEADSSYTFGFIYIDLQAGFTFDYASRFQITNNGLKKLPRPFEAGLKSRLSRNTMDVAILSEAQIKQLELPKTPEWLAIYKEGAEEPVNLKNIGFHYNAAGASKLALEPLLKAYQMEPHIEGLEFELAYAYNATRNFEKAIPVLEKALKNDPKNFWFYRELGFSLKYLGQVEKAEKIYLKGMELTDDKAQKAEIAINMAQSYAQLKNEEKFNEWAKLTKKYSEKGSRFVQYIDSWAKSFKEH